MQAAHGRERDFNLKTITGANEQAVSAGALQKLTNLIHDQELHPGMRLPSERNLAEILKVGRPAVREAIRALQVLDVVESRRGDGTYVKSLAGLCGGWSANVDVLPDVDTIELLEVRRLFEPGAAARAAARATAVQLEVIEQQLLCQERDPEDYKVLERHDVLFHEAIIEAAGNVLLSGIMRNLSPLLLKSLRITVQTTPDIPKVIKQHRAIFEAIRHGQSDLAETAMREHLQTTALDLLAEQKR